MTIAIPTIGAQRSGDFRPEANPVRTGFDVERSLAIPRCLAASTSNRTTVAGTTRLIDKATSPTAPAAVGPRIGWRTAKPNTGVADVDSISAYRIAGGPRTLRMNPHA